MSFAAVLAFCLFAFVASITPGPNNLMLLASGMNFGVRASLRHMFGIAVGFFVLVAAVGLGLAAVFDRYPASYAVMKWAGAIYLVYLAWRVATAGTVSESDDTAKQGKPLGFFGAALFQWINPKAWAMAVSAFSTYVPSTVSWGWVLIVAALFALIGFPCIGCWTLFGSALKRWLRQPTYARMFNVAMAVLLLASLWPLLGAF